MLLRQTDWNDEFFLSLIDKRETRSIGMRRKRPYFLPPSHNVARILHVVLYPTAKPSSYPTSNLSSSSSRQPESAEIRRPPSSTMSIPKPGSHGFSPKSPITRSTGSTSCCPGVTLLKQRNRDRQGPTGRVQRTGTFDLQLYYHLLQNSRLP